LKNNSVGRVAVLKEYRGKGIGRLLMLEIIQQAKHEQREFLKLSSQVHAIAFYQSLGLSLMGMTYGPIGTVLSEIFPTSVRYTGSALTFNLAGIFGASFAPLIATKLATTYGLQAVGYYLTAASILSLLAFLAIRETKNDDVNNQV
jgi:fucose permease